MSGNVRTFSGISEPCRTFVMFWSPLLCMLSGGMFAYGVHFRYKASMSGAFGYAAAFVDLVVVLSVGYTCVMCFAVRYLLDRSTATKTIEWSKPTGSHTAVLIAGSMLLHALFVYNPTILITFYGAATLLPIGSQWTQYLWLNLVLSTWGALWFLSAMMIAMHSVYCYFQLWALFFATEIVAQRQINAYMASVWFGYLANAGLFLLGSVQLYVKPLGQAAGGDWFLTSLRHTCFANAIAVVLVRVGVPYFMFQRHFVETLSVKACHLNNLAVYVLAEWTFVTLQTLVLVLQYTLWADLIPCSP